MVGTRGNERDKTNVEYAKDYLADDYAIVVYKCY